MRAHRGRQRERRIAQLRGEYQRTEEEFRKAFDAWFWPWIRERNRRQSEFFDSLFRRKGRCKAVKVPNPRLASRARIADPPGV